MEAVLQLGKNGLTQRFIDELLATLKKKKQVKVKILRNSPDTVASVVEKMESQGINTTKIIGRTITFSKKAL